MDPEIPCVSVVDLGMIREVAVEARGARVVVLPTFTGCPAVAMIEEDIRRALADLDGIGAVAVELSFSPPWTTERITAAGRSKLREFGVAPPHGSDGPAPLHAIGMRASATCPFCGSSDTRREGMFGPTPCRAVYYCRACRNPFEQFKTV
jgi:ring-1,2-phenylacetyl-CoA epoxidase subunit PaaD